MLWLVTSFLLLRQWFSTISPQGANFRPTILLESGTVKFHHRSIGTFCFIALTKSVEQNVRGVTERLLRAAQRMLGYCMQLLEQCLKTIVQQVTPRLPRCDGTALEIIKPRNKPKAFGSIVTVWRRNS